MSNPKRIASSPPGSVPSWEWPSFTGIALPRIRQAAAAEPPKAEEKKELIVGKWYPSLEAGLDLHPGQLLRQLGRRRQGIGRLDTDRQRSAREPDDAEGQLEEHAQARLRPDAPAEGQRLRRPLLGDAAEVDRPDRLRIAPPADARRLRRSLRRRSPSRASSRTRPMPFGRKLAFNPMQFKESAGIARKILDTEDRPS